jgi:hypothetical protein
MKVKELHNLLPRKATDGVFKHPDIRGQSLKGNCHGLSILSLRTYDQSYNHLSHHDVLKPSAASI